MINRELLEEKYRLMKDRGLTEDILDFEALGELKIFINHKPKFTLCSLRINSYIVFVGSDYLWINESTK